LVQAECRSESDSWAVFLRLNLDQIPPAKSWYACPK
jgi:hypothetical protein